MSGDYSPAMKEEFMNLLKKQNIPLYGPTGHTLDYSELDPDKDGNMACVPTAGQDLDMLDSNYKVVLSPDVSQKFRDIMMKAANINYEGSKTEIGFLMVGEEKPDKTIAINRMEIYSMNIGRAGFNDAQHDLLMKLVDIMKAYGEKNNRKPFFIFGHTHPEQREFQNFVSNSWSLGDLWSSYVANKVLRGRVQYADLLITPSMDTNLLFFEDGKVVDENFKGFYRFAEGIHLTDLNGKIERINHAYSDPNSAPQRLDPKQYSPDILK